MLPSEAQDLCDDLRSQRDWVLSSVGWFGLGCWFLWGFLFVYMQCIPLAGQNAASSTLPLWLRCFTPVTGDVLSVGFITVMCHW